MFIPSYVWKLGLLLLFIKELRYWFDMILDFERANEVEEMPESVKHMYS